jgi:hypothetical protein
MQNLISFIHPATMWGVLGLYCYTGYLGWRSRRIRSINAKTGKELVDNYMGFKHSQVGVILLGLLISGGSLGLIVTYINTKTILHGIHGKVGILMMILIALTVSLTPSVRRGENWARIGHISIGVILLLLYLMVEIPSGVQIVQSILKAG